MEVSRVWIGLDAPSVEQRRQIGAAAEPRLRGRDEARIHVDGGNIRVPRMRDERNSRGPKSGIGFGARDLRGEFGWKSSKHRRGVHRHFLEHAAAEDRRAAAAAIAACVIRPRPGFRHKLSRCHAGLRKRPLRLRFQKFAGRDDLFLQLLEPGARLGLVFIAVKRGRHSSNPSSRA